jgi:nucleotide-binding universal stress UspA family protein
MLDHTATAPEAGRPASAERAVVGYDGSPGAARALKWAIEEALMRQASLEVITAWVFPMAMGYAFTTTVKEVREEAERTAEHALGIVKTRAPKLTVHVSASESAPGPALVDASRDADLLVVGSRGLGGFRGLLLGSVGAYCARHASCSVAIIR